MGVLRVRPEPQPRPGMPSLGRAVKVEYQNNLGASQDLSHCVTEAVIKIAPDRFVEIELSGMALLEEVNGLPFMSEEAFVQAAERYGYEIQKKREGGQNGQG